MPPAQTIQDQVRDLLSPIGLSHPLMLDITFAARGDTNAMPLLWADGRRIPRTRFASGHGYYTAYTLSRVTLERGMWSLSYSSGMADLYDGNGDAAQLYLDSIAHSIDGKGEYHPYARMNRSAVDRLSLAYVTPYETPSGRGSLRLAANVLSVQRAQFGVLSGDMADEQLVGKLNLLTTRGLPDSQTRSVALSLDAATVVPVARRLRCGFWAENLLGHLWQRRLQDVRMDVATNSIEPDSDGFLHGVPILAGTIGSRALDAGLRRRYTAALALRDRSDDWLLMGSYDANWRVAAGFSAQSGRGLRWWSLYYLTPAEWQAGLDMGNWQLEFGTSTPDPGRARRADISISYRVFLEHGR